MRVEKRQIISFLLALIIGLGSLNFGSVGHAESSKDKEPVTKHIETKGESEDKISEALKKKISSDDDYFDVMVLFKEGANLWRAKQESHNFNTGESKELKERKAVIGELKETAYRSQNPLKDYLDEAQTKGLVKSYQSFYIVNSMHLIAKKEVIEHIAKEDQVELIDINKEIKREDPIIERPMFRSAIPPAKNEVEWNISRVGADQVWDKFKITGKGVTVGIMDSAVNVYHPALKNKFKGYDPASGDMNYTGTFIDAVGYQDEFNKSMDSVHGSHCMGTILGSETDKQENSYNRIGIAPDAKFITARVFGNGGSSSTSGFMEAAQWMIAPAGEAANAPAIINNSWGGGATADRDPWFQGYVEAWRNAGILPVFASGNQGPGEPIPGPGSISTPASYRDSFAVGAVDHNNKLATFSKQGPSPFENAKGVWKPEISAPGVTIRSSVGSSYMYMRGTSMAAPHVAGVAALIKSANTSLSHQDIQDIIQRTATPLTDANYRESPNHGYGYGLVNAYGAVSEALGKGNGTITGKITDQTGEEGLAGEVYIKETDRMVKSDSTDGTYSLKHPAGEWTLVVSVPGYEVKEEQVTIAKDGQLSKDFTMVKKDLASLNLTLKDSQGNNLSDAFIRILEDSNINFQETDGSYQSQDLPVGEYTIRIFKEGMKPIEEEITLVKGANIKNYTLEPRGKTQEVQLKYDNDKMNYNYNENLRLGASGLNGGAVKFIPQKKDGVISSISIQFGPTSSYQTYSQCKVSIRQADERGRTFEIMKPMEVNVEPGKVKTISIDRYQIKTDKPYYVVVEKANNSSDFAIGLDQSGDRDYSYIYSDNNFYPLYPNIVYGALMIRSTMSFPVDAEEIDYNVNKPSLDAIHPQTRQVKGKAEAGQEIQLSFSDGLRINEKVDKDGNFSILVRRRMIPGEEVLAYAKDSIGIKSEPARGIVLTDPSKLEENMELARKMENEKPDSEDNKKLKQVVKEAEELLEKIKGYESTGEITSAEIKAKQKELESKTIAIRDLMLKLSPQKEKLKKLIDSARKDLDTVWISQNGRDVPATQDWVTPATWAAFNGRVLRAHAVYLDTSSSIQEIDRAIASIKDGRAIYDAFKRKGYIKVLTIDDRYEDGFYEGEGRGRGLLANHIVIQIASGKIVDIQIKEWYESEASRKAIEMEGFLEKIIATNALDIKPVKGYEVECRAIISAISQAIEKGIKEGEPLNNDKTPLLRVIEKAEEALEKYKVSDGQDVKEDEQWISQEDYDAFKKHIDLAKKESEKDLTKDLIDREAMKLEIALRNFDNKIKTGPLTGPKPIGYRDGSYEVEAVGNNIMSKNRFKITIKDGKITAIEILHWADTGSYEKRMDPIIKDIIDGKDSSVDVISGATKSYNSVKEAVKSALEKAAQLPEDDPKEVEEAIKTLNTKIFTAKRLLYKTEITGSKLKVSRDKKVDPATKNEFVTAIRGAMETSENKKDDLTALNKEIEKLDQAIKSFEHKRR